MKLLLLKEQDNSYCTRRGVMVVLDPML